MTEPADLTPTDGIEEWAELDGYMAILFTDDGRVLFRHRCDRGDRGTIVCAPELDPTHILSQRTPPTITPSILCPDCGTHGHVIDGRWHPA